MAKLKKGKSTVTPANNKTNKVVSAQLQKKISKQKAPKEEKGVVFIKNLPHGFYEEQLKRYFRQFGEVTRLRLARSKKTGGSKGYAFIEFEFPEVADYAAEAMNNYLMFQKIVKAQSIPPEKQKYNYFKTKLRKVTNKSGREIYISGEIARTNKQVKRYNDSSDAAYQKRTASAMKTLRKANAKFAALGLDVDIALKPIRARADANDSKEEEDKCEEQVGSLLLVKKQKSGKSAKIGIKQLLEETIPTDDDDEDYNGENDDNNSVSSNEMSYGLVDSEDEKEKEQGRFVKNKKPVSKLDKLIKKKPLAGGIQKYSKKCLKEDKKIVSAGKTALKKSAVQEIVAQGKAKKVMKAAELFKKKGTKKKSS